MAVICNKRKSARYLWTAMVVATIVLCAALVYISLMFGTRKVSASRNLNDPGSPEKLTEENCISLCESKECVFQSKTLLDNIKPAADPCENFHEYACGKLLDKSYPDESINFMTRYSKRMRSKLRRILENLVADPKTASGKMKSVYDSCMKYNSSDLQALPTIFKFLSSLGIEGWPNLGPEFKFVNNTLTSIIGNFLLYQEYGFVEFHVENNAYSYEVEDYYDSLLKVVAAMGTSAYEKMKNSVRKFQVDRILNYFNLDFELINQIWDDTDAINDAIINLKEESKTVYEASDIWGGYSVNCTEETEQKVLCECLESFIDTADAANEVSKNFLKIRGEATHFIENIFPLLQNFSERSVANYLVLNVFLNNLDELSFYFRLAYHKDKYSGNDLFDSYGSINRRRYCVEWLKKHMPLAIGHEYVKEDLTISMIEDVRDLALECIRETADLTSHQKWMTEEIRMAMAEEIGNITVSIDRFLEVLPNETHVNLFYQEFHPSDENFFQNVLKYKKAFRIKEMRGLLNMRDTDMQRYLLIPSAVGGGRQIGIMLGLLIPPTYLAGLQRIINLVSLGMIVVHEAGHNINSIFHYFKRSDPAAGEYFTEKQNCIVNQYSQFRFESIGKNVNGTKYMNENYADTIAISVVDKLIEKYASGDDEFLLPALPYSLKQLLYLSCVQIWCSSVTKRDDEVVYDRGFHSAERFRLLGMMQNSKGFSDAFSCPKGSYMNPSTKCLFLE